MFSLKAWFDGHNRGNRRLFFAEKRKLKKQGEKTENNGERKGEEKKDSRLRNAEEKPRQRSIKKAEISEVFKHVAVS